jgi:flagellar hook-length control protein FliK
VRIDIVNDKANVVFGATHADTRAALSEAIPRLREMFAGAGLTLGDAGVRQDSAGHFSGSGPHDPRAGTGLEALDAEPAAVLNVARIGLVDAYA